MNSTGYLAYDPHLKRQIAVKEIDHSRIADDGWDAYHREAQSTVAARHDHVAGIIDGCLTPAHLCAMSIVTFGAQTRHDVDPTG